jgi:hypothetical protein
MSATRLFKGLVFAAFAMLAGCADADESIGVELSPTLEPQGGLTGTGGLNGASPAAYHANIGALLSAFSVAAADPSNASAVNPALQATGLLNTAGGREVFSYAARCALPTGAQLANGADVYTGGGILSTTASWLTGSLTTAQKEDALTCMIAHLNPFDVHVPIFFSGPNVTAAESSDDGGFGMEEAIWQAKLPGAGQAPIYYAWPRVNLLNVCGLLTDLSWITRICGSPINTCGVQVRYDRLFACSGSNGNFTCNGKPTIETSLREDDICSNHLNLL